MQDLDPKKNFKIGNLCINDDAEILSIVEEISGVIPNEQVWGEVSRVLNPKGKGGSIQGNLAGYGCRFEIDGSSYHLGTILNPTSLKIFSKSKAQHHAVFDKTSGAFILGEGRVGPSETDSIFETWAGVTNWKGVTKFHDNVAFLPGANKSQIVNGLDLVVYTFVIPPALFPLQVLPRADHYIPTKLLTFKNTDFIDVYFNGTLLTEDQYHATNNTITLAYPFSASPPDTAQAFNVYVYLNSDARLKVSSPGATAHFMKNAKFYQGAGLIFSTEKDADEESITNESDSKYLKILGPEIVSAGDLPEDDLIKEVLLIIPGDKPKEADILQYTNDEDNLEWKALSEMPLFSKLALGLHGLTSLTNSQLLGLIFLMRMALSELGKPVPIPADYETIIKNGGTIVMPTKSDGTTAPPAGTGGSTTPGGNIGGIQDMPWTPNP